jgi:uncharacterized membrane protein
MIEMGYLAGIQNLFNFMVANASVDHEADQIMESLTFEHFQGAFFVLLIGHAIACIVFLCEIITFKHHVSARCIPSRRCPWR